MEEAAAEADSDALSAARDLGFVEIRVRLPGDPKVHLLGTSVVADTLSKPGHVHPRTFLEALKTATDMAEDTLRLYGSEALMDALRVGPPTGTEDERP